MVMPVEYIDYLPARIIFRIYKHIPRI